MPPSCIAGAAMLVGVSVACPRVTVAAHTYLTAYLPPVRLTVISYSMETVMNDTSTDVRPCSVLVDAACECVQGILRDCLQKMHAQIWPARGLVPGIGEFPVTASACATEYAKPQPSEALRPAVTASTSVMKAAVALVKPRPSARLQQARGLAVEAPSASLASASQLESGVLGFHSRPGSVEDLSSASLASSQSAFGAGPNLFQLQGIPPTAVC